MTAVLKLHDWLVARRSAARLPRTPTVLQMEAVECGAAALAMILAYHGRWVSLESLRLACGVSRDGAKASNLLRAARAHGFTARGFRKEPEELRIFPLPCIVFWNFNHYLVLEGFAGGYAHLNDPALGRRRVALEEFDQSFTGVALSFERAAEFQPCGEAPSVVRAIRSRAAGLEPAVLFLVLVGLTLVLPGLAIPTFAKVFVDRILIAHSLDWLRPLLIGIALTAVLRALLGLVQNSVLLRVQTRMALVSAGRFFWHLLRLPVAFYTQRSPGEIGARLGLNEVVSQTLAGELAQTFLALLTALFFGLMLIAYDVWLALVAVAAAASNGAALAWVAGRTKELSQRVAVDAGKLQGASLAGLAAMETLKSSGGESGFFSRWAGYQARFLNGTLDAQRQSLPISLLPNVITGVANALILGAGGLRVMQGALSIGELVAFQTLAASFLMPVTTLVGAGSRFQQLLGNLTRLDDVLRYPAEVADTPAISGAPAVHAVRRLEGFVELRNVTFGYNPAAHPLLENLSLSVAPGQRVALVGPSGCGKSTVSRLLMGLYEPWSGEVLFDGKPRKSWPRQQLAASVAMVDQDIVLFGGRVRDNLVLWDSTISEQEMVQAARDACIHDVIIARPGGYDADLAEGGFNLSGGQRQRLEIARALAGNPRVLVLDEATSALDPATEQELDDHLRRRGITCIVIAHRLSTVRDADEIIVLHRGRVAERGRHAALMSVPPATRDAPMAGWYHRLVAEGLGS